MAKRYYIARVVQDPTGAYGSAVANVVDPGTGMLAFATTSKIATDPNTGLPLHDWCLTIAAGPNHGVVAGNPDIDALPAYPLDARVSAMHTPTRNAMAARMQARGIDPAFIGLADGFRDVLDHLGRIHDPAFTVDDFDAQE